MKPWYEQDEFWEAFGQTLFAERHWSAAPAEVDGVISLLRLQPGTSILDLCCGPGRHSLELTRRGFRVTGVDRTRHYLDKAATQAEREGLKIGGFFSRTESASNTASRIVSIPQPSCGHCWKHVD